MAFDSRADAVAACCRDGHRFYVYDRAMTAQKFHSFAMCTRCGEEWYRLRDLKDDILWIDGSHPSETPKE